MNTKHMHPKVGADVRIRNRSNYIILHCDVMHDSPRLFKKGQRQFLWMIRSPLTIVCNTNLVVRRNSINSYMKCIDLNEFIYWLIIYAMLGQCLFLYRIVCTPSCICWGTYYFTAGLLRRLWQIFVYSICVLFSLKKIEHVFLNILLYVIMF